MSVVVLNEKGSAQEWELRTVFNMVMNLTVISAFANSNPLMKARRSAENALHRTQKPKADTL